MASGCTFDLSTFQRGLRAKLKVTKKTGAEIINQAAGSTLANAIRLTKKASRPAIRDALQTNGLAFKLLQSPRFQHRLPAKLQGFSRGTHSKAQIIEAARRLVQVRVSSAGNVAAGFIKALQVFRPANGRKVSDKGLAGQGSATRATESKLTATFDNAARGAVDVASSALQQALDEEGRSMKAYAEKKLADAWR